MYYLSNTVIYFKSNDFILRLHRDAYFTVNFQECLGAFKQTIVNVENTLIIPEQASKNILKKIGDLYVDLKFDNNMPIYFQIMNWIKEQIVADKFSSGSRLPSVRDMSEQFNVTPNTIQRVYRELEFEGIIFTQRGIGVFITQDADKIKNLRLNMSEQLVKNFLGSMKTLGFNEDEIVNAVIRTAKEGGSNADDSRD